MSLLHRLCVVLGLGCICSSFDGTLMYDKNMSVSIASGYRGLHGTHFTYLETLRTSCELLRHRLRDYLCSNNDSGRIPDHFDNLKYIYCTSSLGRGRQGIIMSVVEGPTQARKLTQAATMWHTKADARHFCDAHIPFSGV